MSEEGQPSSANRPCILLVEGSDDRGFFAAVARQVSLLHRIRIVELGGKDQLRDQIEAVSLVTGLESIGIVLDADDNPSGKVQAIRSALQAVKFAIPSQPLIRVEGNPAVVFMTMPHPNQRGALEDLCLIAFENDDVVNCLQDYVTCLKGLNIEPSSKALLRMLIASKPGAEKTLQVAVQRDWWPWNHEAFNEVKEFIRLLAGA